mgnify:CR=1 FL=1
MEIIGADAAHACASAEDWLESVRRADFARLHPAVQRNVSQLVADGVRMIDPGAGWLSCRQQGTGRMAEPHEITSVIRDLLSCSPNRPPE